MGFVSGGDCSATRMPTSSWKSFWMSSESSQFFMSCLFLVAVAWLHQIESALLFFYIAYIDVRGRRELDKKCVKMFSLFLSLSLFLMTNFQYCCNVLDSGMFRCLSVLTHAVCIAPERLDCQELHRAKQNRTTFVMCFQAEADLCCVQQSEREGCFWLWSIRQIAQQIDTTQMC